MKKIAKFIKIVGIVITTLIVVLIVTPFAFRSEIEALVKREGNKLLNAQFDFEKLDISLLRNFPQASVSLHNFWLKGVDVFENDTLVYAGEVTAAVNVSALFNGEYEVSKIIIDNTRVKAIALADGRVNWDVMKPSDKVEEEQVEEESEPFSFKVALKKLSISDFSAIYDDRKAGMYASVQHLDASCAGDLGSDNTTLKLKASTPSVTFRMGGVPMLSRAKVTADMDVDADLKNMRFTLSDNEIGLNAIRAGIDGWVALDGDAIDMDLALRTNDIGFKEILSLIPAIYMKDFADLRTDGVAALRAKAKGRYVGEQMPAFDVSLEVKDAMFRYPALPAGVDAINIAARVQNPGGSLDKTSVSVNPFDFTLAGNPFSLTADVKTPLSDPDFSATANGTLDLGKVKDVYPLEGITLNGVVGANVKVAGRLSYIEQEQFDRVEAEGELSLSDMAVNMEALPNVYIERSTFGFTPRYLELTKTTVKVGENDLTLDSRFENYMGYLLKGTTLKGVLNVSSNHINVNDFLSPSEETAEPEAEQVAEESTEPGVTEMTAIEVPANIDFRAQVNMAEVLMDKMAFRDIKGLLIIKDRKVDMQNLSLNTMGGGVVANGSYATPIGERARLAAGFALNDIVFKQAYQELDMVQKLAPLFEGLSGSFSGSVKVDTPLDEKMSPVLMLLNGEGSLSTKSISLSGISAIDQVADLLQKPELKNINARDLKIDFTIKDGRVQTKPFDIKMGDYVMNLSGSTGLDQTIDYVGKIAIPASAGELARLGSVDMTITGTFSSPKVGIDLKGMAKQALDQVVDQVKEQAEQKVDEIKQQAEQKIEDVKQQAQQRVEETKQQVEQKVEQAKQEAKQQVEQKVEEAKQQAQQKVDEVKQQAQQKAQEAAKDAVSKILGGSANSAQGEAVDSLSQQQKTTEAVKGVLNLFKKKN